MSSGPAPKIAPFFLSILTSLIPKVVDFGISLAGQNVQAKKSEELSKNDERSADAVGVIQSFYEDTEVQGRPVTKLSLEGKCVIVVRGDFSTPMVGSPSAAECERFKPIDLDGLMPCQWLREHGIGDVGSYLEARFMFSDDGLSFRLQPTHFSYQRPINKNKDDNIAKFDLTYTFTFEPIGGGQTVTPFAMAVLAFRQLTVNKTLNESILNGKSSGWTPVLPMTEPQTNKSRLNTELFTSREQLAASVARFSHELVAAEASARTLMDSLLAIEGQPPLGPTDDPLEKGMAFSAKLTRGEKFDDALFTAQLDSEPATNPAVASEPMDVAVRKTTRQRAIRENSLYRASVRDLKSVAENSAKLRADLKQAAFDLQGKESEIQAWRATEHPWGAANIKVNLREKPDLPTNVLLLTAADAFLASSKDLSTLSQNIVQGFGLEGKDARLQKISDQAQLLIAAKTALNVAKNAAAELADLATDASDQAKRDKAFAVEVARINANVAFLKAGFAPPFPDAFAADR
jgi:hypothetical protein